MLEISNNELIIDDNINVDHNRDSVKYKRNKTNINTNGALLVECKIDDDYDEDDDFNNDYKNKKVQYINFNRRLRDDGSSGISSKIQSNDKIALLKKSSRLHSDSSSSETSEINPFSISDHGDQSDDKLDNIQNQKKRMGFCEIFTLNLTYMGLNMMFLLLSVEIVPAQIEAIVGSTSKGIVLGLTVALGAIVTFIIGPLVGMKSDNLVSRFGRRRPIIGIGAAFLCVVTLMMVSISPPINSVDITTLNSNSCSIVNLTERRCNLKPRGVLNLESQNHNKTMSPVNFRIFIYVPFYLLVISGYIATITPYNALIADKSRPDQRGLCSGAMGGMILLGNILGACLGLLIAPLGAVSTVFIGLVVAVCCVLITIYTTKESCLLKQPDRLTCREKVSKFYTPLKEHDFRWLFITRFLMQQGLTSIIGFLEYYVKDMIPLPPCWNVYRAVSYLLLPMLISAALSSIINGVISDRTGKRKLILIITSIVMAIISICMTLLSGPAAYYIAIFLALIFGIALGGYQAIDFALLMDILPEGKDQSLRIAVWHQAMVLPQALAVPVAGIIVDLFERVNCTVGLGYLILMCLIATYFLLGGLFINKIKSAN